MKKTSKYMYDLIASKRKKLLFEKKDIPFNILRSYLLKSPHLEELYFRAPNVIKQSEVFGLEQLNLLNLKVLDLMGLGKTFTEKASLRLIRRCKNIEELRLSSTMKLGSDFFFGIRELKKLAHLAISSIKMLSGGDILDTQDVLKELAKHVNTLKLKTLSIYELNEEITTAYSK